MKAGTNYHLWILGAVIMTGASLRFLFLDKESLWFDEALSVWFSQRPLPELWGQVPAYETHPPMYYTILKGWGRLFGDSETALRSLSALAGSAAIFMVYLLGRIAAGGKDAGFAGAAAAAVYAFAPVQLLYAQEARPYALLTLAVTTALCGALWLAANPERAAKPRFGLAPSSGYGRDIQALWAWLALILGTSAAMWLHNMSIFFALSLIPAVAGGLLIRLRFDLHFASNAFWAALMALALWSPFVPWFLWQSANMNAGFWLNEISAGWVISGFKYIFLMFFPTLAFQIFAAGMACAGLYVAAKNGGFTVAWALAGMMIIPLAAVIGVSAMANPIFVPRTMIWAAIPFYALIGAGFAAGFPRVATAPLFIFLCAALLFGDYLYFEKYEKEPWRQMVGHIASTAKKGDVVLLAPNSLDIPYSYYAARHESAPPSVTLTRFFPGLLPGGANPAAAPGLAPEDLAAVDALTCEPGDVWVLLRYPESFDPAGLIIKRLSGKCALSMNRHAGAIYFLRFTRRAG